MSGFRLPDLGEGLHEAEIVAWHVGPGDHVVADQPLVAVETDKAVVEVPSPRSGHIARLHAAAGSVVQVGELLVEFADEDPVDVGAIVGRLDRPTAAAPRPVSGAPSSGQVRATPAVRARARRLGIDIAAVSGTGPDGTVSNADLDAAAAVSGEPSGGVEPLRGVRRAMAVNMERSAAVVPATVTDDADVGEWAGAEDPVLRLVRAIAVACSAEPALNMAFQGIDGGRRPNVAVDLGIAMDTADGLFVPVLRDVAGRSAPELRSELDELEMAVRSRSVAATRLRGQTITLSNFGSVGGRHAALVVVPPQVAIVGAGVIADRVLAVDGQPSVRRVLPLSLTFDHRAVTGGEAARFLTALIADLELPT